MKTIDKAKGPLHRLATWFTTTDWKGVARNIIDAIGRVMNRILFHWLLPKKYRDLTKRQIFEIIFKSDTPAGKKFDIWLLVLIVLNILVLVIDSLFGSTSTMTSGAHLSWGFFIIKVLEWAFTLIFTFEYYLRIYCLKRPKKYVTSFWGIIDFLSIFPAYLSLFWPTGQALTVLRLLRTMRIFRIFRLERFQEASGKLLNALKNSALRIIVSGIYWAVVTITTVGYGDITPITLAGRFIAVLVMLLGYAVIAVPMGIVAGETIEEHRRSKRKHYTQKVVEAMEKDFDEEEEAILH